jgi:hypothetical protein
LRTLILAQSAQAQERQDEQDHDDQADKIDQAMHDRPPGFGNCCANNGMLS